MAKKRNVARFDFKPLAVGAPTDSVKNRSGQLPPQTIKVSANLPPDLHEHLMSHCFFDDERPTQEMAIIAALEQYLADKPNKPLPEHIKNRPKPGRKRKNGR